MTQTNKNPKKFGLNLACNMAAECLRENYAPTSIILANLLVLQKADTFPKELTKEFFKRPVNMSPSDTHIVRALMDALRSPNNGVSHLLNEKISADWAFKKAPPVEHVKPAKFLQKPNKRFQKTTQPTNTPKVVVKKSSID